jgi:hypothetical protein
MGAIAGVRVWSYALLLQCVVGEGLAAGMLAEPDGLWGAVGETDHVVFPACVRLVEHMYLFGLPTSRRYGPRIPSPRRYCPCCI